MTRFIDRSNVNGPDSYKTARITHIYLKATEGTGFVDSTYHDRKLEAEQAGAVTGAYHFADLQNPATEVEHFLAVIGHAHPGHFRPCLDLERGTVVSDVPWAETWIGHFHKSQGYLPTLYGSTSLIAPMRTTSALIRACPWWRAEYGPNDGKHHALQGGDMGAAAHQYTSVATFPGISGNTDASVFVSASGAKDLMVPTVEPPKNLWTMRTRDRFGKKEKERTEQPAHWLMEHPNKKFNGRIIIDPVKRR